jgi:hypothetical protein
MLGTIDDPAVLGEIGDALAAAGFAKTKNCRHR